MTRADIRKKHNIIKFEDSSIATKELTEEEAREYEAEIIRFKESNRIKERALQEARLLELVKARISNLSDEQLRCALGFCESL